MAQVIIKFGDDISTDTIYPGRFMATVLPTETPAFAFADYKEFNKQLNEKKLPQGSIIVGGNNFGCGSSREQAVSCLKGHELVIVAKSYARIFLQNAVNLGLQAITAPEIDAAEGDELVVEDNRIVNKTTGKTFAVIPLSGSRQAVMNAGGLIRYTRERLVSK